MSPQTKEKDEKITQHPPSPDMYPTKATFKATDLQQKVNISYSTDEEEAQTCPAPSDKLEVVRREASRLIFPKGSKNSRQGR